jgi:hypothetical protein
LIAADCLTAVGFLAFLFPKQVSRPLTSHLTHILNLLMECLPLYCISCSLLFDSKYEFQLSGNSFTLNTHNSKNYIIGLNYFLFFFFFGFS